MFAGCFLAQSWEVYGASLQVPLFPCSEMRAQRSNEKQKTTPLSVSFGVPTIALGKALGRVYFTKSYKTLWMLNRSRTLSITPMIPAVPSG